MGIAPLFKRNDTVYMAASAAIGQLEGYRIASVVQRSPGIWLYQIQFQPKPPESATIGDRYDQRYPAYSVMYSEIELMSLCDALVSVISNLEKRINRISAQKSGHCPNGTVNPIPVDDTPLYQINDTVYIKVSAKIGFIERAIIANIHSVQAGTATNKRRFVYQLTIKPQLFFSEDELTNFCEAADLVVSSLDTQLTALQQQYKAQCKT